MNQIGFSQTCDLPDETVAPVLSDHTVQVKQEYTQRIAKTLDLHTLVNAQTVAVVGRMSPLEIQALTAGQRWIEAMLATTRTATQTQTAPDWPLMCCTVCAAGSSCLCRSCPSSEFLEPIVA